MAGRFAQSARRLPHRSLHPQPGGDNVKVKNLWGAAIADVLSLAIVACGDRDTVAAQTIPLAV